MGECDALLTIEGSRGGARLFLRHLVWDREKPGRSYRPEVALLVGYGPAQEVRAAAQWIRQTRQEPTVTLEDPAGDVLERFHRGLVLAEDATLSYVRLRGNLLGLRVTPPRWVILGRSEDECRERFWRLAEETAVVHPSWRERLWAELRPLQTVLGDYRAYVIREREVTGLVARLLQEGAVEIPPPALVVAMEERCSAEGGSAEDVLEEAA
ncbi:MAG TPA: hypothetical protein ENK13_01605 [Thermopetrobacter sp.]|nr:hypothetical protein [Thermopetrobacter sp.]